MRRLLTAACAAALLAAPSIAFAQEASSGGSGAVRSAADRLRNANAEQIEKNWARATADEQEVTTSHSITAHGRAMRYKATAGTLTVRNDAGMPTASRWAVVRSPICTTAAPARRPSGCTWAPLVRCAC
jgi:hypothetical protein